MEEIRLPEKRNNLKTKLLPSLFMLFGGAIALIIGIIRHFPMTQLLLVVFLALLFFAILGTVIKSIVDKFNMTMSYDAYFEDSGDLVEKGK